MAIALLSLIFLGIPSSEVLADGTETLGPPSIPIAAGTDIVAAGTGLNVQPGDINFDVPAGATVVQVLLYWEGQDWVSFAGDHPIIVNGNNVTGTQIGGPIFWLDNGVSTTYRADITGLGLVGPGANTLTVEALNFTNFANGAGVLVIIDDGSPLPNIEIRDGNDLAFIYWPVPMDTTVAQTFTFAASSEQRTGTISMLFSAVSGTNSSGGDFRPTAIDITVGGITVTHDNLLDSLDGQEWDTLVLPVTIPAGETSVTVQALSVDNLGIGGLPASLTWNAAAFSILPDEEDGEGCTPGFWRNPRKFDLWPINPDTLFSDVFGVGPADPLADTIRVGGGGENSLIRHGTAAYLNALSPAVAYLYSPAEVIAIVQEAYATGDFTAAKNLLELQNEIFCPLG
jgi:hypothetical protein